MVQVKKDLPLRYVRGLAKIGCTQEEAAAALDMSISQFKRYLQSDIRVREAWDAGRSLGRIKLRGLQWWHAMQKGPAGAQLTIHLSKHQLGETDTSLVRHEHSGQINLIGGQQSQADAWFKGVDIHRLTDDEAIQFAELCDMIDHLNGSIALLPPDKFQLMTELVRKGQPAELVVEPEQLSKEIKALPPPDKEAVEQPDEEQIEIVEDGSLETDLVDDRESDFITNEQDPDLDGIVPPPPKNRRKGRNE